MTDGFPTASIDRRLGWLIALGGSIVLLDQTIFAVPAGGWAPWWTAGALGVVGGLVALAAGGPVLPMAALTAAWRILPVLFTVLQAAWPLAYRGPDATVAVPWLWTLEPPVVTMLALVVRPVAAVTATLLISSTPALASLVALGPVPTAVLVETPHQWGNVAFVVLFIGIRRQLGHLRSLEVAAQRQQHRQIVMAARVREQARLTRIVHDEVLSVLAAAILTSGPPPVALRQEAAHAQDVLDESAGPAEPPIAPVPAREAAAQVAQRLRGIDRTTPLDVSVGDGELRRDVVDAVALAAAEALRNSLRHAGGTARRRIGLEVGAQRIRVSVVDDGRGFIRSGDGGRLGLRESIEGRMAALGGSAVIRSRPGDGTEVTVSWPM